MDTWAGIDEFVAVANTGSFIGGAAALGLSRSHMSRTVAQLEDRLGARLFHRTTRSVKLTPTGRIFLVHCARLVRERAEALALVREQGGPRGELRITCSTALGERFIAPITRGFAVTHPQITVVLDLTNRLVDLVEEGCDLGIRTGHLPTSDLIATKIASRQFYTCASPAYLDRKGKPTRIEDIDEHDCLVGSSPVWHFTEDGEAKRYRPRPFWSCNNGQAVFEAALENIGICQLPDFYLNDAFRTNKLVPVLDKFAPPGEPIWAVYPDKRHLSPKVRRFVTLLKTELPKRLIHE